MKTKVAIYGFGRLGRSVCNVALKRQDLEVIAIYSDMTPDQIVEKLQHDDVYSPIEREIVADASSVTIDGTNIVLVPRALGLSWQEYEIDVVVDCESEAATKDQTAKHEKAGAKRVVFAAAGDELQTIILGVNESDLATVGTAISAGGAAAAAVAPVQEILAATIGTERSLVTTVDGTWACSKLGACDDGGDEECICATDCACDSETNVAVLPAPTLVASISELVVVAKHAVTADTINKAIQKAAAEPFYQGIVSVSAEPIASDGVIGESSSAVVDLARTDVQGERLISVKLWYDREWAYANRLVELSADFGKTIKRT